MKKNNSSIPGEADSYRLALEAANIGIWEYNTDSSEFYLSDNIFTFLGISREKYQGSLDSFLKLVHKDDREIVKQTINATIKNRIPFDTEFRMICAHRETRWFRIRGNINFGNSGQSMTILGSIHDKTDRKLAFDTLEERVRERTSALVSINRKLRREIAENRKMKKIIMELSEKERQKIGQDLHDGLSQQLGGILFMIETLAQKLSQKRIKEKKDIEKIRDYLNNALKYLRNISKGLYLTFGETGLQFALMELSAQFRESYGMDVSLNMENWTELNNDIVSTNIFRITQEALNNAVKHGNASRAVITLSKTDDRISLTIRDFGKGFPPSPNKKGLGLKIMEYRASQMEGSFCVESIPQGGTLIRCQFSNKIITS